MFLDSDWVRPMQLVFIKGLRFVLWMRKISNLNCLIEFNTFESIVCISEIFNKARI